MSMIQAGMIGVIGAMLAIQLKGSKAEYGDLCKRSGKHCSICAHLRQAWYFRSYCKRTYSIRSS